MTGSSFYSYVLKKFKRTDKETEAYQAMTDVVTDMRVMMKSDSYKEEAYATGITTLGDFMIALPSDFGQIIGNITVVDVSAGCSYEPLTKLSKQEYDDKYPQRLNATVSNRDMGVPVDYCIFSGNIYLGPVPDKITYKYQMNYTTEDYADITSATTNVPFTDKWRNVVRDGVLWQLFDGVQAYDEANYYLALFRDGVQKIIGNDEQNTISNDGCVKYSGV